jgi:acyl-coenzyme A thioesterase PaaI-like protein
MLGWELVAVDPGGHHRDGVRGHRAVLNPFGMVQGGLLAAMLDDTLGPALVATLGPESAPPPTCVQFLRPARPGRLVGGAASCAGPDVGFMAGELADAGGGWPWPRPPPDPPACSL